MPHPLAFSATFDLSTLISVIALVLAGLSYRRARDADERSKGQHGITLDDARARRAAELSVVHYTQQRAKYEVGRVVRVARFRGRIHASFLR